MSDSPTLWLNELLTRLRAGDSRAREELLAFAVSRLERLAHAMLRGQFGRVGRWVETGDVLQNASLRLWKALSEVTPESPLHFHRLASRFVRLELLDLARHFYGPQGVGAHHESVAGSQPGDDTSVAPAAEPPAPVPPPEHSSELADLHAAVGGLPDEEAVVTDLLFYQGLQQEEAAVLLGVDVRTVQRRWQRAKRKLGEALAPVD